MSWSLRLAEFDFDIEHRPGIKIRHVDHLSRHVQAITNEKFLSKDLVRVEQKRDKFCSTLQTGKPMGKSESFYDEEGFIYRRRKNGEHQLVDPRKLVREVIALNHETIFAAHPEKSERLKFWV